MVLGTALLCTIAVPFHLSVPSQAADRPVMAAENISAALETYLVNELKAQHTSIQVASYKLSKDTIQETFHAFLNRHPELYFVQKNFKITWDQSNGEVQTLEVAYRPQQPGAQQKIEQETQKVLSLITEDMSTLQKVITIHDYLCVDITYAHDDYLSGAVRDDAHTLKGALVDKIAVCDGYTSAFQYYMNLLGIPSRVVSGQGNGEAHAWSQVCIDGSWYMLDITWDDPVSDNYGNADHTYFLKSDDNFLNHTWDSSYEPCTDDSYENAFWNDVHTQLIRHDDAWYYIDPDGNLSRHSLKKEDISKSGTTVTEIGGKWYVYGSTNRFYNGYFTKLAARGDLLYYSQPSGIYSCHFDGSSKKTVCTADTSKGYIYGMKLQGDTLIYQIAKEPYSRIEQTESVTPASLRHLSNADVRLSADRFPYAETLPVPAVSVTMYGKTLMEGADYELSFRYPGNGVGTVTLTVTGKGMYEGAQTLSYEITKAEQTIMLPQDTFAKTTGDASFSLGASALSSLQYVSNNPEVAAVNAQGVVTPKGAGTAIIEILASETEHYLPARCLVAVNVTQKGESNSGVTTPPDNGNGQTTVQPPAKVKKVSAKAKAKKKILVKWQKQNCDGYRIQVSRKANFRKIDKTITVRGQKKVKRTISGLRSKTKYYVRIQAYKNANGTPCYGKFSKKMRVRVK